MKNPDTILLAPVNFAFYIFVILVDSCIPGKILRRDKSRPIFNNYKFNLNDQDLTPPNLIPYYNSFAFIISVTLLSLALYVFVALLILAALVAIFAHWKLALLFFAFIITKNYKNIHQNIKDLFNSN